MISQSIRSWLNQQNQYPCFIIYTNTPIGIFTFTDIESKIERSLDAIEWICLSTISSFKKVTRVEIHAISGIDVELIEETVEQLIEEDLIQLVDFDKEQLNKNIDRIKDEIGEDWLTPKIQLILSRKILKQYEISDWGKKALKNERKEITTNSNLDLIITGEPFYVFNDTIELRQNGFEDIEMNNDVISQILSLSKNYANSTGIFPKKINSNSVAIGKEIPITQFWISVNNKNVENPFLDSSFMPFLSSRSFEKWINVKWNDDLKNSLPSTSTPFNLVVKAISENFQMVESVVSEGLQYDKNSMTWFFECDLEMLMLINNHEPDLISKIESEISLKIDKTNWNLVLLTRLEALDDLADLALKSSRFHSRVSKRGFTLDDGFETWSQIMKEWGKKAKLDEFNSIIQNLVKYKCLIERDPSINKLIIDLDNILSYNRRGSQNWSFYRIRRLWEYIQSMKIKKFELISTSEINLKIDDEKSLGEWIKQGKITIGENEGEIHPSLIKANQENCYYVGNRRLPKSDDFKNMRDKGKKLRFTLTDEIRIPGIEPFYDWRFEDILLQMFNEYYE